MKLRIRSLDSKETLKIETPSLSTLQDLKNAIAEKISAPSETLNLSLNRKDLIQAASNDSLQSIGIASGDLIFYNVNPNGFSGETLIQNPILQGESSRIQASNLETNLEQKEKSHVSITSDFNSEETNETLIPLRAVEEEETLGFYDEIDENPNFLMGNSSPVPCFLRKIFKEKADNIEGDQELLIIAVHAVFLESGFVGFDSETQKRINGFHLPKHWASNSVTMSVWYTVPGLVDSDGNVVETAVLKFQILGKYVNVHGSLSRNTGDLYRLCLDKSRFLESINFMFMNQNLIGSTNEKGLIFKASHERVVFEFWKTVKDGLALPLLINLCEKTGLDPPPCFMRLPTELKLKILEFLPAVDIAKTGCVCLELRNLSSNIDLWKQKFEEEFTSSDIDGMIVIQSEHWKEKFVGCWENRKRKRRAPTQRSFIPFLPQRSEPNPLFNTGTGRLIRPFSFPGMLGGDRDRFPAPPLRDSGIRRSPVRRGGCIQHPNLGGSNA